MPGLPPIDMGQLKNLLRDPEMPAHKILKEMANTIDSGRSDGESEPEDHQPAPNIFDMIIEASIKVDDDDSDVEEEAWCHVPHDHIISCPVCDKVFPSSWPLRMHMAVAHTSEEADLEKPSKTRLGKRSRANRDADSEFRDKKFCLSPKNGDFDVNCGEEKLLIAIRRSQQVNPADVPDTELSAECPPISSSSCDQDRLQPSQSVLTDTQEHTVTSSSDTVTSSEVNLSENPESVESSQTAEPKDHNTNSGSPV